MNAGHDFFDRVKAAGDRGPPPVYEATLQPPFWARTMYAEFHAKVQEQAKKRSSFRHSMRPKFEHGMPPELSDLKSITLREVAKKVNHVFSSRALFLKTVTEPTLIVGLSTTVVDEANDFMMLSLYNFLSPRDAESAQEILPAGTYLALLAPYMRNSKDDREQGALLVRCDNPQCVVLFDDEEEWMAAKHGKTADGAVKTKVCVPATVLREKGNQAFTSGKYRTAIQLYSKALKDSSIGKDDTVKCLSNRAEAYLRRGQWELAERDAKTVIDRHDSSHVKARVRLVKALVHMNEPAAAEVLAEELIKEHPNDTTVADMVSTCQRAQLEQQGTYDLEAMRKEARRLQSSGHEMPFHADFVSPSVKLGVHIPHSETNSYRGCIALKDLKEGDLITASKAFVYADGEDKTTTTLEVNAYSKSANSGQDVVLMEAVIARLLERPSMGMRLYSLSAGPHYEDRVEPEQSGSLDIPRIRGILASNPFGATTDEIVLAMQAKRAYKEESLSRSLTKSEYDTLEEEVFGANGSGLWLKESLFNHSCTPNCRWICIGDHMFIKTTRTIDAGDELCIGYTSYEDPYQERVEKFANWVIPGEGFRCVCEHCSLLRSNRKLRDMEQEVNVAYKKASQLLTLQGTTMAAAAIQVMSQARRDAILSSFAAFPLHLQHTTVSRLVTMEGTIKSERGDYQGALEAYKKAAAIGYAVRGGAGRWGRAEDLWRIVGATLRVSGDAKKAIEILREIYESTFVGTLPKAEAAPGFVCLTLKYALPWWVAGYEGLSKRPVLAELAKQACRGNAISKQETRKAPRKKLRKGKKH